MSSIRIPHSTKYLDCLFKGTLLKNLSCSINNSLLTYFSYLAVEEMRRGSSPSQAGELAIQRIVTYYPKFVGAIVVLKSDGEYGAACHGLQSFQFSVCNTRLGQVTIHTVPCVQ
jgi:hypothetical protein